MNVFAWIFMIIGVVCLLYFAIIVIYTKVMTAFGWFFITVGIGSIILSKIYEFLGKQDKSFYPYVAGITYFLLIISTIIFISILMTIIRFGVDSKEKDVEYLIILGARINGKKITKSLRHRLEIALTYLRNNDNTVVIVSGGRGSGETITEALAMKDYLLKHGLSENRILMEDKSTNTHENLLYSSYLIKDKSKKVIIVTNSFHLYRSLEIAKKQNYSQVYGLGAPSDKILFISYYIREVLAILKDKLHRNMQ